MMILYATKKTGIYFYKGEIIMDLERIKRIATDAVQSNTLQAKQNAIWQILDEFNIHPENVTNADPPSYYEQEK